MLSQMAASFAEVHVITRSNNRPSIESKSEGPKEHLHFHYVDLPAWARAWKKGQRGMRLYYLLWQVAAFREARRLVRKSSFDCVWHLTIANAWLGSLASLLGRPFVYGPIGGGVRVPIRLVPALGVRGAIYEIIREASRLVARYFNPLARVSWQRAGVILAQNAETRAWFPLRHQGKVIIFQNSLTEGTRPRMKRQEGARHTALTASRLLPWKGIALAIRAVATTNSWRLLICGSGPDKPRLKRLVQRLGLDGRVEFRGHLRQSDLQELLMSEADVLLFPSLHDDGALAVAEAVVAGLPVICLDIGGPPLTAGEAGIVVSHRGGVRSVVRALGEALSSSSREPEQIDRAGARLQMKTRSEELERVFRGAASK